MLELEFQEYQLPSGERFPIEANLHSLDNAREAVTETGAIRGVLAARSSQSFIQGMWHRPSLELFQHSFMGLTGASGKIFSTMSLGPLGGAAIFGVRVALFRMAEPEIQLPAGTEMRIHLNKVPEDAPVFSAPEELGVDDKLADALRAKPVAIMKLDGRVEKDIINIAFDGSREEVVAAFLTAGWKQADQWSLKTFERGFMAYNRQTGFATAPISRLYYKDSEPDLVFQKSLDTMSKRHHIRLWRTEIDGEEFWLGAATHDIGVAFHEGSFSHRIHPKIDYERSKVIADLTFSGCVDGAGYVDRPALKREWSDGAGIVTDGRMAIVPVRPTCTSGRGAEIAASQKAPRSMAYGLARRLVLEGRNYVLRSNPYFLAYDAWRWRKSERHAS
jgi:LssY C-terminus